VGVDTLTEERGMAGFSKGQRDRIQAIRSRMRVSKVVCTRSIRGPGGESFLGWSVGFESRQVDAGGASDLMGVQDGDEEQAALREYGMSRGDAKLASLLLGLDVDLQSLDNAVAGNVISAEDREKRLRAVKANYQQLLQAALGGEDGDS